MKIISNIVILLCTILQLIFCRDFVEADYVKGKRECLRMNMSHAGYFNSAECKKDCCTKVPGCEGGCSQSIVRIPKRALPENIKIMYYTRGVCCAAKNGRKKKHFM